MKAPRINFAPASRARVSAPLWVALVLALGVAAGDAWLSARARSEGDSQALQAYARATRAAADMAAQQAVAPVPAGTAPQGPRLDAAQVLRAVESLRLPGARVGVLLIDLEQGLARVEVELADPAQIVPCLDQLNAASPGLAWQATGVQVSGLQRPDVLTLEARAP